MTQARAETRQFSVRARHVDSHHARVLKETSFEAAAVAYLEDFPQAPDGGHDVSVIVQDMASGLQHCFRVDLDTGEAEPCP